MTFVISIRHGSALNPFRAALRKGIQSVFFALAICSIGSIHGSAAVDARKQAPTNAFGAPVLDAKGGHVNYSKQELTRAKSSAMIQTSSATGPITVSGFVPSTPTTQPFWQYSIFGSGIGASNIVVGPIPAGGGVPEIIIGGNSTNNFGGDDFWQSIRRNAVTGSYETLFVSPIYSAVVQRIALANVVGDSKPEIVVMLADGRIYFYDFATKTELGYVNTGISGLQGLALADLDGDNLAELIVTTSSNLYVFNSAGNLLWQVPGAGGSDVVVGQMDNDPALEIATTSGNVVDCSTHSIQWTRNGGFGVHLALAPLPGQNYQQLVAAQSWQLVFGYDIANQVPLWSITTPQDIGAILVADVDGDNVPEIIIGDNQWGTVHVHELITHAQKWSVTNPEHGVTNLAVADVDGDGVPDLLWGAGWTSTGPDYLYVANTTGAHSIKWQSIDLQGPFVGPAIGDLDGDGKPELVVCSYSSNSGYDSGRILVFDLATLTLRGISAPVVSDDAWTGVHDLKLRDVAQNGRMQIVIAAEYLYDGAIEVYDFDTSNVFTRTWTNATRPSGSPFNFVEVADLDGNGTRKIIGGNTVATTGSTGAYVYVYDYPSGAQSWQSVNLASGFSQVSGLIVGDLDGNGSKEIAALVGTGDLYTWDAPTRQLRNLRQATGFTTLANAPSPSSLIGGDGSGFGHFLQYAGNTYVENFARQFGTGSLTGINLMANGQLWIGNGGALNLFDPPSYNTLDWQSPNIGTGFGRFVVTNSQNGQGRIFSSARQGVIGLPAPPLSLVAAASRKTHGSAGVFDINLPLTGSPGIECRSGGANGDYTLVLTFSNSLAGVNAANVSGGGGSVANSGMDSNDAHNYIVNLTGVTNAQSLIVTLNNISDLTGNVMPSVSVPINVLIGDSNSDRFTDAIDVSKTKSQSGKAVTNSNFREDVNTDGFIDAIDVSLVKSKSGTALP